MSCTSVSIHDIPYGSLKGIFAHLSFLDLLRCQRVSQRWNTFFRDAATLAELTGTTLSIDLYKRDDKRLQVEETCRFAVHMYLTVFKHYDRTAENSVPPRQPNTGKSWMQSSKVPTASRWL